MTDPSRPRSMAPGDLLVWWAIGTKPDDRHGLALWEIGRTLAKQSQALSVLRHETPLAALRRTIPRGPDGRPCLQGYAWSDDETSRVVDADPEDLDRYIGGLEPEVQAYYPGPIIESDDGAHWTHVLACIVDACERSRKLDGAPEWRGDFAGCDGEVSDG